jgi:hypothetical protein
VCLLQVSASIGSRTLMPSAIALWLLSLNGMQWCSAQQATTPNRDEQAISVLNSALSALGGQAGIAQIQDATVTGTCTSLDESSSSNSTETSTFTWIVAAREFQYASSSNGQSAVTVSGHGNPAVAEAGTTINLSALFAATTKPFHLPGLVLLNELQDQTRSVLFVGTEALPSGPAAHVKITSIAGGWPIVALDQDWYFDPSTGLPDEVVYWVPSADSDASLISITTMFQSYGAAGGLPFVQSLLTEPQGLTSTSCSLQIPQLNTSPAPSTFDLAQ